MKGIKILLLLLLFFIVSGCALFTGPARMHDLEQDKTYWFDYDASRRGALLFTGDENKKIFYCAEPSPDVALQILSKFSADIGTDKLNIGTNVDIQEKVIQLAKRTQSIMFLREALYRLCELSLNMKMNEEEVKKLYEKVIDAVSDIAKTELINAEREKKEAERKFIEVMQKTPEFIDQYKNLLDK